MRTHTCRNKPGCGDSTFIGADPSILRPRSRHSPNALGQHHSFVSSQQTTPRLRNEVAEILTGIDGAPVLVRLLLADIPAEVQSGFVSKETNLHSLLSTVVEKMSDTPCASPLRHHDSSKQALTTVGWISSAEHLARLPPSNDTVLRVGPLELDLLDRTAKRGDRQIDLRPREFQLLKYLMQRSDTLLTRAALLNDVWSYKFVPETNLVDVYMSKLRRKVDGPNEPALIRNVRGAGLVLSAIPFPQYSTPRPAERAAVSPSNNASRPEKGHCHCNRSRQEFSSAHRAR